MPQFVEDLEPGRAEREEVVVVVFNSKEVLEYLSIRPLEFWEVSLCDCFWEENFRVICAREACCGMSGFGTEVPRGSSYFPTKLFRLLREHNLTQPKVNRVHVFAEGGEEDFGSLVEVLEVDASEAVNCVPGLGSGWDETHPTLVLLLRIRLEEEEDEDVVELVVTQPRVVVRELRQEDRNVGVTKF